MDEERAQREQRKREREEQHLYLSVGVVTDESFKHYQGFDLTNWESDPAKDPAAPKFYRILRSTTIKELTGKVAEDTGQDPDFVRLWAMVNRQNQTIRPDQYLKQPDMTVDEAHAKHGTKHSAFRIWAEVTTADGEGKPVWPDLQPQVPGQQEIVIFVKYFDAKAQSLRGVGHLYTSRRARVSELVQPILRLMGWPDDTAIDLFEVGCSSLPASLSSLIRANRRSSPSWSSLLSPPRCSSKQRFRTEISSVSDGFSPSKSTLAARFLRRQP